MNVKISFYQVSGTTPAAVAEALPALLAKALQAGPRVVVRCPTVERRDRLNQTLWQYEATAFLPHGIGEDGHAEHQPVLITADDSRPNNATVLVAVSGALGAQPALAELTAYARVLDVFAATDTQTTAARQRWQALKTQQASLTYYAQTEQGWQQRG